MGKRESNHFSSSTPEDEAGGSAPERLGVVRMAQESNGRRELLRSLGAWGTQYKTAASIPAMPKPRVSVAATVSDQVRRAFIASSSGRVVASAAEQLTWPR